MNSFESAKRSFGTRGERALKDVGPLNMPDVEDSDWYDAEEATVLLTV
jgi:hypothetical protein